MQSARERLAGLGLIMGLFSGLVACGESDSHEQDVNAITDPPGIGDEPGFGFTPGEPLTLADSGWQWVDMPGANKGLFDLANDLGETKDLSKEKPEVLAKVKARFNAWKKEMDAAEPRGPFRDY